MTTITTPDTRDVGPDAAEVAERIEIETIPAPMLVLASRLQMALRRQRGLRGAPVRSADWPTRA